MSGRSQRWAVVFGAAPVEAGARLRRRLAELAPAFVVAADGGADLALRLGMQPDVVIGDFDSLDATALVTLKERGTAVETHPRDKDATDGQLAVERALQVQPQGLVLVGFLRGARLDHELANVLLLTRIAVPAVLLDEHNEIALLRGGHTHAWTAEEDEIVSLMPLSSEVTGLHTQGLRWALSGERLRLGQTRGVSNEPETPDVRVAIDEGLLLIARYCPRA